MSELPKKNLLNYQYTLKKMKARMIKQVLFRVGNSERREGIRKLREGKYGRCILYACMKVEQ
jgi:hypothetical protein